MPRKKATPTLLGNHIIRKRKAKGWTTADLAREAELPYGTVRNVEKGYSKKPAESILRALIKALELDESIIFAAAGYGALPGPKEPDVIVAELDALGEDAPLWKDTIEYIKRNLTPDQQQKSLEVLRAQSGAASRHW